jgi:hypothetical protein
MAGLKSLTSSQRKTRSIVQYSLPPYESFSVGYGGSCLCSFTSFSNAILAQSRTNDNNKTRETFLVSTNKKSIKLKGYLIGYSSKQRHLGVCCPRSANLTCFPEIYLGFYLIDNLMNMRGHISRILKNIVYSQLLNATFYCTQFYFLLVLFYI